MVKTYNNIAEYAKKLLIEANPYIDEKIFISQLIQI